MPFAFAFAFVFVLEFELEFVSGFISLSLSLSPSLSLSNYPVLVHYAVSFKRQRVAGLGACAENGGVGSATEGGPKH